MDDKGDATEASNAYNKLAGDNNVLAVAGPTISATTAAVAPLADQSKLVTIAPGRHLRLHRNRQLPVPHLLQGLLPG